MEGAVIPTIITAEKAAGALGIGLDDLADNCRKAVADKLRHLAASTIGRDTVFEEELAEFDNEVAAARRMLESAVACDQAYDKQRPF